MGAPEHVISGTTWHLSANAVHDLLIDAHCGVPVIYARGDVACDKPKHPELAAVAGLVWQAYRNGKVELLQRRLGPGVFAYILVKRAIKRGAPARLPHVELTI